MIRPQIVDYLAGQLRAWALEAGLDHRLGITTNGTLLTRTNCEMLKRHGVGVQLSLDGSREGNDVHRQLMGGTQQGLPAAGAFHLVRIENYMEYFGGKQPNCRMTVTIHNVGYLSRSVRDLHQIGFKSFSIIPDADCGAWTPEHLSTYEGEMGRVFEYWANNREIRVNAIDQTLDKLCAKTEAQHLCQVATNILGITVDGDIYPCHDFSGKFSGDPGERGRLLIGNVDKGFTANQFAFRDLAVDDRVRSPDGKDCAVCWAKWACTRGCPYMNYTHSSDIRVVNPSYCATVRITSAVALKWMSILEDVRFVGPREMRALAAKIGLALLKLLGGDDKAPFGKDEQGHALPPTLDQMRELGFDFFGLASSYGPTSKPCGASGTE